MTSMTTCRAGMMARTLRNLGLFTEPSPMSWSNRLELVSDQQHCEQSETAWPIAECHQKGSYLDRHKNEIGQVQREHSPPKQREAQLHKVDEPRIVARYPPEGSRTVWGAGSLFDRILNEHGIAQVLGVADPEILQC